MAPQEPDSSAEVVNRILGKTLLEHAFGLYGGSPRFWGRYFKTPEQQGGTQYNPKTEHAALASAGIRVVPIPRQTGRIHGSKTDGATDAKGNVLAIFAAFGIEYLAKQGGEFYVYLDDEGAPSPHPLERLLDGMVRCHHRQQQDNFRQQGDASARSLLQLRSC